MSANTNEQEVKKESNANAFINKPYDFQRLRKVIGNIVNENKFPKSVGYIIV